MAYQSANNPQFKPPILDNLLPRGRHHTHAHLRNDVINELQSLNWSATNDGKLTPTQFFDDFWQPVRLQEIDEGLANHRGFMPQVRNTILTDTHINPFQNGHSNQTTFEQMAQDNLGLASHAVETARLQDEEITRLENSFSATVDQFHPIVNGVRTTCGSGQDLINILQARGSSTQHINPTNYYSWSINFNGRANSNDGICRQIKVMPSGNSFTIFTIAFEYSYRYAEMIVDPLLLTSSQVIDLILDDIDNIGGSVDWGEILQTFQRCNANMRDLPILAVDQYQESAGMYAADQGRASVFGVVSQPAYSISAIVHNLTPGAHRPKLFPFSRHTHGFFNFHTFVHEVIGHAGSGTIESTGQEQIWSKTSIANNNHWITVAETFFGKTYIMGTWMNTPTQNILYPNGTSQSLDKWYFHLASLRMGMVAGVYTVDNMLEEFLCRVLGMLIINRGATFADNILPEINRKLSANRPNKIIDRGFGHLVDAQLKKSGLKNRGAYYATNQHGALLDMPNSEDVELLMARAALGTTSSTKSEVAWAIQIKQEQDAGGDNYNV